MLMIFGLHAVIFARATDAWYGDLAGRLDLGLTLFFMLSGFLMYRPFVAARVEGRPLPSVRRYFRRRALRIVPAFWVALLVVSIYPGPSILDTGHWFVYPLFLQQYSLDWLTGGVPIGWSLCVEVAFYIVLPLVAVLARRLPGTDRVGRLRSEVWLVAAVIAAGLAFRLVLVAVGYGPAGEGAEDLVVSTPIVLVAGTLDTSLLGVLDYLALGMALAVASVGFAGRAGFVERRPELLWGAALALFAMLALVWPAPDFPGAFTSAQRELSHLLYGVIAALILAPAIFGGEGGGPVRSFLRTRWLAQLGVISYGFYLYHVTVVQEVLGEVPGGFEDQPLVWTLLTAFPLTLLIAAVSYYGLERHFLRRKEAGAGARPGGFEPPASRSGGERSIH